MTLQVLNCVSSLKNRMNKLSVNGNNTKEIVATQIQFLTSKQVVYFVDGTTIRNALVPGN